MVNNAGISNYAGCEWSESTDDVFLKPLLVNTLGTVRVTRACLPLLRNSHNSRVIVVGSMAGRFAIPVMVAYSMSKFAARAFADGLRREIQDTNVQVVVIEPAMYKTGLTDAASNLCNLSHSWQQTDDHIKQTVGKLHYESMRDKVKGYLATTRDNPYEVVDTMIEAILTKSVDSYYSVCGWQAKVFFYVMQFMPIAVQDLLLDSAIITRFNKYFDAKA